MCLRCYDNVELLIEGEIGNDFPDNAPPSPIYPELMLSISDVPPTPPPSPPSPDDLENVRGELINIPLPVNLISRET